MNLIVACLLLLYCVDPTEIRGKVIKVSDGDTIAVLVGHDSIKVRLEGIDAPEKVQPFGMQSKLRLSELVGEKDVRVVKTADDLYGRSVGTIYIGGMNVNQQMVHDGLAWHYKAYSKDPQLNRLEQEARVAGRGLWSDKTPIPPWEFRRERKRRSVTK